ncbi:transcription factor dp-1- hypothetical protein [Limosa lapponica baueri]|uniref:Uncharacterized protein n=1 Tax=Limosa lapponica baueri TaxID=1758121 RepID=A0A2I0TI63_LIMLA|nr:transcription factor dp-1- hypothetical protein [Limosa lapponica baueri]
MVSTWKKTMASVSSAPISSGAASQMDLSWEHAATQTSGCRVCPALMPVSDGSSEHACGRCAQVEEFLCLVMELREEVGSDEEEKRSPRAMKRDFRTLGRLVKGSGAQVMFSSVPPAVENEEGVNRKSQQINAWLQAWCYQQDFGFFDHGLIYKTPGLLVMNGNSLFHKGF